MAKQEILGGNARPYQNALHLIISRYHPRRIKNDAGQELFLALNIRCVAVFLVRQWGSSTGYLGSDGQFLSWRSRHSARKKSPDSLRLGFSQQTLEVSWAAAR